MAQNQAAMRQTLADASPAHPETVPMAQVTVPVVGRIVIRKAGDNASKHRSMWTLSMQERRANWLRLKHPKMSACKRELWANAAELKKTCSEL